jgi:hypothetical protein
VKEGEYGGCILYSYDHRTVKSVEIVLRSKGEGMKEKDRGGKSN